MPRTAPRFHGFTLLEVLVALAVVSIALLAAMRASGGLQDDAQRYLNSVLAEQCAQNYLVEQRLRGSFAAVGVSSSTCTEAGIGFTLSVDVQRTPNPNFRRLDVRVLDASGWSAWQVLGLAWNP